MKSLSRHCPESRPQSHAQTANRAGGARSWAVGGGLGPWKLGGGARGLIKTSLNPDTGDEMDAERVPFFFLQFTSSHLIASVSSPAQLVGYSRPGASGQVASWVMDRGHGSGS